MIKVKCVKCNKEFIKDPRYAKPIMLCPLCDPDSMLEGIFGKRDKNESKL